MRVHARAGLIGLMLMLALGCGQKEKQAEVESAEPLTGEPTRVVAKVGEVPITLAEVNRLVQAWKSGRVRDVDTTLSEGQLQQKAVDNLIEQEVLKGAAKDAGLLPSDEEVKTAIDQLRQRFPDEAAFQQALQQQGLTIDEIMEGYRAEMGIRRFIEGTIKDTIQVTPEQIRGYYDTHPEEFVKPEGMTASHIFLRLPAGSTPEQDAETKARAEGLLKKVQSGADFAAVARESSEDGSAQQGGDLGAFTRGQMVPAVDSAAFALGPGEISELVRSPYGYHIIKAGERTPAGSYAFEEITPQLTQKLQQMRTEERVKAVIEERKKKVNIKREV